LVISFKCSTIISYYIIPYTDYKSQTNLRKTSIL